jgi:hypothetical protein
MYHIACKNYVRRYVESDPGAIEWCFKWLEDGVKRASLKRVRN